MMEENANNLLQECQNSIEIIAGIEKELQILVSRL